MRLLTSPVLIITDDVVEPMKRCSDQGFSLVTGNAEDIHDKLQNLKRSKLHNPVAIGDINPDVAGRDIEQKLLKVLEEMKIDAMFFSSRDGFSVTFISRFMQVIKQPKVVVSKTNSREAFLNILRSDQGFLESARGIVENAPAFLPFFMQYRGSRVPSKQKILELL